MARIVGVDIPNDKVIVVSLTYIYGIGPTTSKKIVEAAKIDPLKRVKDLSEDEIARLRTEEVFQLEVKEQKLTLVHAKVHVRQLLIRKKLLSNRR